MRWQLRGGDWELLFWFQCRSRLSLSNGWESLACHLGFGVNIRCWDDSLGAALSGAHTNARWLSAFFSSGRRSKRVDFSPEEYFAC